MTFATGFAIVPTSILTGRDEMAADQGLDRGRHRRGEAERLPVERSDAQDPLDLRREAHVEHAVGLVENDDADGPEAERPALEMIGEPAGSRHDDVRPLLEPGELRAHRLAADENEGTDALGAAEHDERLGDLKRKLARRREHERTRPGAGALRERDAARVRRSSIGIANAAVLPVPV